MDWGCILCQIVHKGKESLQFKGLKLRIFALATVMSSVLIYNLPETIREADISRLSFAVELAEEFYGRFVLLPVLN
ncbi:uncharacterized protein LOC105794058 isoform X1 [Gossypium raimondii]|uniref:uncharacterized protein LOC105794058 isoform X1 n=1 Tax=Gossypium raimondii TaxID=29730 RepID=UPI00227AF548|nr:uncharacterized protein LOC105794058 isoform X1 [Gossypium raimondii]